MAFFKLSLFTRDLLSMVSVKNWRRESQERGTDRERSGVAPPHLPVLTLSLKNIASASKSLQNFNFTSQKHTCEWEVLLGSLWRPGQGRKVYAPLHSAHSSLPL